MGCCSSVPSREEEEEESRQVQQSTTTEQLSQQQTHQAQQTTQEQLDSKHSEINVKRDSSSFHSNNNHSVSNTEKSSTPLQQDVNTSTTWPIFVRLSNNGQDITIQVPTQAPYLTVAGLKEALLPHLEKEARVRLIYLGRILPDQHMIVPTETDDDIPLPPPKKRSVLIQKEGVIQAMITTTTTK